MQYEIQYKIKPRSFGSTDLFPILYIRYRILGTKKWDRLPSQTIDRYTFSRFRGSYYEAPCHLLPRSDTTAALYEALYQRSDYERLELFMRILRDEFDGSVDKLVRSIVKEEVVMENAEFAEQRKAETITMSLVTDGWRGTSIEL